jgi:deoxyribose-phosphate aldolase
VPKYPTIKKDHFTPDELAALLDHSLLRCDHTKRDLEFFCGELKEYNIKYCCVNSGYVADAVKLLKGTDIHVGTSIAFPIGQIPTEIKVAELERAIKDGCTEFDFVANVAALKIGDYDTVKREFEALQKVGAKYGIPGKAIIETCFLNDDQMREAGRLVRETGLEFIKTSTGFAKGNFKNETYFTNVDEINLLKEAVGLDVGVKASSGATSYEIVLAYFKAGASRIGTHMAPALIRECAAYKG